MNKTYLQLQNAKAFFKTFTGMRACAQAISRSILV